MTKSTRGKVDPTKQLGKTDTAGMKEFMKDLTTEVLRGIPAEERVRGIPAEEVLRGIPAEERVRGIPAEKIIEALDDRELARMRRLLEHSKGQRSGKKRRRK